MILTPPLCQKAVIKYKPTTGKKRYVLHVWIECGREQTWPRQDQTALDDPNNWNPFRVTGCQTAAKSVRKVKLLLSSVSGSFWPDPEVVIVPGLWVIWGQCCPRVTAVPCTAQWPNHLVPIWLKIPVCSISSYILYIFNYIYYETKWTV